MKGRKLKTRRRKLGQRKRERGKRWREIALQRKAKYDVTVIHVQRLGL
jgi:hypothetical protein